jgi:Ohr subfamily peroxiredoxin
MTKLEKAVYTAEVTSTGGRDGHSKSPDGVIDFKMGKPAAMGGKDDGYNPEQLFAAGYSACYLGALKFVAGKENIALPDDASVTAKITFGPIPGGFGLAAELVVKLPGVDAAVAKDLAEKTHKVCPYSNATRGNIDVTTTIA